MARGSPAAPPSAPEAPGPRGGKPAPDPLSPSSNQVRGCNALLPPPVLFCPCGEASGSHMGIPMVPSPQTWACRGCQRVAHTGRAHSWLLWPQAAALSAVDRQLRRPPPPSLPPSRLPRLRGPTRCHARSWGSRGCEGGGVRWRTGSRSSALSWSPCPVVGPPRGRVCHPGPG